MIKQRLREMIPGIQIFLDVDDLEEIGDLEGYVARSHTVLVYLSAGYTASKNVQTQIRIMATPIDPTPICLPLNLLTTARIPCNHSACVSWSRPLRRPSL